MISRRIAQVLNSSPLGVGSWRHPSGECIPVALQLSSWLVLPTMPASHLPRMRLVWGHGEAQHQVIADLPAYSRLNLVCSAYTLSVWSEQDDTATPTVQTTTSPIYHIHLTTAAGTIVPRPLTYTSRAHSCAAAFTESVPAGASSIWTVVVSSAAPPFAPGLPPGYIYVRSQHAGAGPGGAQTYQAFDASELLNRPHPIAPQFSLLSPGPNDSFVVDNNFAGWQPQLVNPLNTETVRLVFGIEV